MLKNEPLKLTVENPTVGKFFNERAEIYGELYETLINEVPILFWTETITLVTPAPAAALHASALSLNHRLAIEEVSPERIPGV